MKNQTYHLFYCIKRAKKNYENFSAEYSLDDLDLFDCCMHLQNFTFIINQIMQRLNNSEYMKENFFLEDIMLKELNYFSSLKEAIEQKRMEMSIVKIPVNTYLFSEN